MWAAEVVVHVVQAHRVRQVLDLLGEPVGEPREAAHSHPHGEVLTLHVAGRDVCAIRLAVQHLDLSDLAGCR